MLIDLKSMLTKLTTPRSGFAVVKLNTASNVGLYVRNLESESKLIKLSKDNYVFHLQPGDVILQGNYARGSKVHVVNDLSELNGDYKLFQLDPSNNFYPLIDIPSNFRRKAMDDSLNELTKALLSMLNKTEISNLVGIDFHPINDVRFNLMSELALYENSKAKRTSFKEVADVTNCMKAMLNINHNSGCAEFIIWHQPPVPSTTKFTLEIAKGVSIQIADKRAVLMFDTEVFPFGTSVLDQITKPYKRDEIENPISV